MDYTTTMGNMFKKITTLMLVAVLSGAPLAYAQEIQIDTSSTPSVEVSEPVVTSDIPVSDTSTIPSVAESIAAAPVIDLQGTLDPVQNTTDTQNPVLGNLLETTANPETSTDTDATTTPLVEVGTTTPIIPDIDLGQNTNTASSTPLNEATSTLDVVAKDVKPEPELKDPELPDPTPIPDPQPAVVSLSELAPEPDFTFSLTGKQIPTKKILTSKDGKKIGEQIVASPLTSQVDNAKGVISVSGQCTDVYFVVLLYKKQNDYVDDPSSYLVNRAYPCVNGSYSYAISELPSNLPNGPYYLLVGQEGNTGTWTPITSLTEIDITNN